MDFTDEQILFAINRYQKEKEYKRNYYNKKYHSDVEYQTKMKEYSKKYYLDNKERRKEQYENNN